MTDLELRTCRVCGFIGKDYPWGLDNKSPEFFICCCCGAESGLDDVDVNVISWYRNKWIANGKNWFDKKSKPLQWDFESQRRNIPIEYLK